MRKYVYGKRSLAMIGSVDKSLQAVCFEAQRIANKANSDVYIPDWGYSSGLRTESEQYQLFLDKKSKCDGIKNISNHQLGHAIDFYAYVDNRASYKPSDMMPIIVCHLQAAHNLGVNVNTGALFSTFYDSPHIELAVNV